MSNRSLRGSTKNSRMATASVIAQQSLSRALAASNMNPPRGSSSHRRRSSQSSNAGDIVDRNNYNANDRMEVIDVDNDSSVYSHSSLYSDEFASESAAPLTSYLVAPNKNIKVNRDAEPSTTSSSQKNQKAATSARSKPQPYPKDPGTNHSNNPSSANSPSGSSMSSAPRHRHVTNMNAAAMQIDDAVMNAFRKVRFKRDIQRKKMIQRVLTESRDKVICEALKTRSLESNKNINETSASLSGRKKREMIEAKNTHHAMKKAKIGPATCSKNIDSEMEKAPKPDSLISNPAAVASFIFQRLPSNNDGIDAFFGNPFCIPCNYRSNNELPSATPANVTVSKAKTSFSAVARSIKSAAASKSGELFECSNSSSSDDVKAIDEDELATQHNNPASRNATNARIDKSATCTLNNLSKNSNHAITIKTRIPNSRSSKTTSKYQPLLIEGTHAPRPLSSSCIFLKSHFAVDDEQNLAYIPYFGDDDKEDIVSQLVELGGDAEERMRMAEFGAKYKEEERFEIVDKVLTLLAENDPVLFTNLRLLDDIEANGDLQEAMQSDIQTLQSIHASIAELARVRVERVRERHVVCFGRNNGSHESQAKSKISDEVDNGHDAVKGSPRKRGTSSKKNSETAIPTSYENVMDSYRNLLCRRCFTYDCNLHGNLPKPNLELLGELAVLKEKEGHWEELGKDIDLTKVLGKEPADMTDAPAELTPIQKSICERAFLIFQGDTKKIAKAIGSTSMAVATHAKEKGMKLRPPRFVTPANLPKKKKEKHDFKSMKNYNAKWLNRITSMEIHPAFIPCDHDEPCNDETCSCVKNGFFCTKHCGWGCKSRNFFRGCACKAGQCRSNSCPCFAAKRECDPDLCRACGACTEPPNQRADTGQRCRNDSISMRRHAHLLRAESTVKDAGWGVYTKHALKKGDFVHEYVGEMISQEEAERRGIIYDKMNMSYLFNLTSDFVVDASRKGNKTRYINHSSKPNCEPKMITVNGDIRIGLFAKEDIDAQSELFFDYRYDDHMENDLIVKPAYDVDWMKNPKMANKISKRKNA